MTSNRRQLPAEVVGKAVRVATGGVEGEYEAPPQKNAAAAELGRMGGRKRAESMTPARRAEIAKRAAEKRWNKP